MTITVSKNRFPFLFASSGVEVTITRLDFFAVPAPGAQKAQFPEFVKVFPPGETSPLAWKDVVAIGPLPGRSAEAKVAVAASDADSAWSFEVPRDEVASLADGTADLLIVCQYVIT